MQKKISKDKILTIIFLLAFVVLVILITEAQKEDQPPPPYPTKKNPKHINEKPIKITLKNL